jgi:hypothetical protein
MKSMIIKPAIVVVCTIFVSMAAYGEGADSSNGATVYANFSNYDTGEYLFIQGSNDPRHPEGTGISASGFIGGQSFNCYKYDSTMANLVDVSPTASQGSLQVNTSLLDCSANDAPPQTITINCLPDGQFLNFSVGNSSVTNEGISYKSHYKEHSASTQCTVMVDSENFGYTRGFSFIAYTQYVFKFK